jgi:hypothetical protein
MKTIKTLFILGFATLISSCASTVNFPVSQIVPAADITAKTIKQTKPNYLVTITANSLAGAERLNPPKKLYVIWAVSEEGYTRNVGYFTQKNGVKAIYKASFPYKPIEIIITAEDNGGLCQPEGIEISRTRL